MVIKLDFLSRFLSSIGSEKFDEPESISLDCGLHLIQRILD